jgi:uncharacterized protein involved in outer membrane biogenesis
LDVRLDSHLLRVADLVLRAAGRAPADSGAPLLLSKAALHPAAFLKDDAAIVLHIDQVELTRLGLHDVAAEGSLDHGVLTVRSLSAHLLGGEAVGRGKLDVNQDPPLADVDLKLAGLELAQMRHEDAASSPAASIAGASPKASASRAPAPAASDARASTPTAPPPIEGTLRARIVVSGRGSSLHQVASTANGIVTVVIPHGTVRDSLAEIAGMDLRGLGLLMAKDTHDATLRCAVAIFRDHDGTLTAQDLIADTQAVLITGSGQIRFDTESLDLSLRGEPKSLRLFHLRSPLVIEGTLSHPSIGVHAHELEIVDPGKAKDADCESLIASADSQAARPRASAVGAQ